MLYELNFGCFNINKVKIEVTWKLLSDISAKFSGSLGKE